ncbi:hypothetical protein [Streptomyces sp. NPDC059009]|uniref:hypothetical protein n=1 Tax=Streptomyces sp. NPDC059009 TaxID=3346694 RepID=UPI0036B81523
MYVTVHRSGGRQGLYKARVEQVADAAGQLVTDHMGSRMPNVRIILTDHAGMTRLKERADREVAGGEEGSGARPSLSLCDGLAVALQSSALGQTVLDRRGILMLINGWRQKNLRDLDETLVHELVHCVQLNVPETHARQIAFIRQLYNVTPRTSEFGAYMKVVDDQEKEAYDLERLARKLPPPADDE